MPLDKEKRASYLRKYRQRNLDAIRKSQRKHYEANIESIKRTERERFYRKTYGITIADYDRMLAEQGSRCAICGSDKPSRGQTNFAVDHCHETGRVRGLLCYRCNVGLGWHERHADKISEFLAPRLRLLLGGKESA